MRYVELSEKELIVLLNHSPSTVLIVAALAIPRAGLAENVESPSVTKQATHWIELLAEGGIAGPRFWSSTSTNEHLGTNVAGSLLLYVGRGFSAGLAAEWTRIPWTMRIGDRGHFDTVVVGPVARYTVNRDGRVLPHIYLGAGVGNLSISPTPYPGCELAGGPAARAGVGVDFRVLRQLRLGVSTGVSLMAVATPACLPPPMAVNPGNPTDPGNVWSLRVGGRAEFL
ncbi:MAG TPA: hypothetical protein VIV60_12790 [Polyangiaceae bacterium]